MYKARMKVIHDAILAKDKDALLASKLKMNKLRMKIQDEFFTYMYLAHSDQSKYGSFMAKMDNEYSLLP